MNSKDITPADLVALGVRLDRAREFSPYLNIAMQEFKINTPARQASFLSQVLHESGLFRWLVELWGPTLAQRNYEGRRDLGNLHPGDGYRYRGRGLIQTTGRSNYAKTGEALGLDLVAEPELLGLPELAARSAGWFWKAHGLNELADTGGDQKLVTRRVNGGLNGYDDRFALFSKAQEVLA